MKKIIYKLIFYIFIFDTKQQIILDHLTNLYIISVELHGHYLVMYRHKAGDCNSFFYLYN